MRTSTLRLALGLGVLCGLLAAPQLAPRARACGGFWCSNQAPVNQVKERIVFVDDEGDGMTAVIEITYQGPSEKFAWLIPIPGNPEVAVSSRTAFDRLDQATRPEYRLKRSVEGTCKQPAEHFNCCDGGAPPSPDAGTVARERITVVGQGTVGPYDYTTIAVDSSLREPASAALEWFQQNGYDLTGVDADVLGPYLADGLNLLAFKLTKAAASARGSIRPVILRYRGERPMIPIRPTAVAAEPDMGVLVWIVADARAVPENYRSLVLNEARIDWFDPESTYDAVVSAAADEAGGHGFVTELAGSSAAPAQAVLAEHEEGALAELERSTFADGIEAIWAANDTFRSWDGWRDAVADAVELPEGVSLDQFAQDPDAYRGRAQVDPQGFFAALRKHVTEPLLRTRDLLRSRPYLTRLYTTLSSDEMDVDPVFALNPDLPDVSRIHRAEHHILCAPHLTEYEAPFRIVLANGDVLGGNGGTWPVPDAPMPANTRIEQPGARGEPTVLEDNAPTIRSMLREQNERVRAEPVVTAESCAVRLAQRGRPASLPLAAAVLALGTWLARRRRRV